MPFCTQSRAGWALCISHNHTVSEIGRHIWGLSTPIPYSKQGHLQQVSQGNVLLGFEYNLSGTHIHHPHRTSIFSYFKRNFLYFSLYLLPLLLSLSTTEKALTPSSLLPRQLLIHMGKIILILFARA